ncbi:yeats family protein [Trametopsis cervina]|nr:yeats family protein [Trametopsis cervina]
MSNERVRVRGVSIYRPIIYGNTAVVLSQKDREALPTPDHTHRWTVAVRSAASAPDSEIVGGADDLSYFIKRVTFKLHDTYANPNRNIDKAPFEVSETGWGEFEVQIRINFVAESGEKAITFYHHLKLHPWAISTSGEPEQPPPLDVAAKMGPVHSWQYDEVVFNDPFQTFLNILTTHPPTPLPKTKRRPVPFHTANPGSLEASKGGVPEFTQEMEKEEAERLETARKKVIAEQDKWRDILIEKEKELAKLKAQLSDG